jgi:putative oxygen-independent coproporphyrinogen III oxidase
LTEDEQTHEENEFMSSARAHKSDAVRHLYVHFPFCARICPYCAFYKTRGNATDLAQFCTALQREAERISGEICFDLGTIFFGGGTPTVLGVNQLELLLLHFANLFDLTSVEEWTIECNPGSISAKKASVLRKGGINRVSLGVQSWEDSLLRVLGRDHTAEHADESFRILRDSGFKNISVDLMFALPSQTESQWKRSLERTIELGPEHISAYCLTYEEDTEFLVRLQNGEFRFDDEPEGRFFELAMEMLESAGYEHYEISNYARPGFRSRHNQAYWRGADYIGFGPSAFSTWNGQRWQNIAQHHDYARRLENDESPIATMETLTASMRRMEAVGIGLRTVEGISQQLVEMQEAADLTSAGLLLRDGERLVLTRRGKLLADSVAERLV